jgi:hypothetical protein
MITAFETACGAGENNFRHGWSLAKSTGVSLASSGAPEELAKRKVR